MKALKTLTAGAVALVFAVAASAQTVIRITGSTAFRKSTEQAIKDILNPGYTVGYQGTDITKPSQSIHTGTTKVGNNSVIIKTSWTGSSGGLQALAQQSPVILISNWLQNGLTGSGLNTGPYDAPTAADVSMSDSYQASSLFYGTGFTTLRDTPVGVVTFVWVKGSSNDPAIQTSLAGVTNMTPFLARLILSSGAPLSMLTGASTDSGVYIYPLGRDEDSGTRLVTYDEAGFGNFGSPIQYQPTIVSSVITAFAPWPVNTVNGLSYPLGHSGYNSGGLLSTALNAPAASGLVDGFGDKIAFVGYLSTADAASVNSGNNNLAWNGVTYSDAAVREGKYTFWSYEHVMYRPTLGGITKTVADQLATQILTVDGAANGPLISTMNVSRAVEGGVIIHN